MSVAERSFIITGASQGAGFIFAEALLERGAFVVMADEDEERLAAAAAPLSALYGPKLGLFLADPADTLDMSNLMAFTLEAFDRIDCVINDARAVLTGDALDPQDRSLFEMGAANLLAAQNITQAFLRRRQRLAKTRGALGRGILLHLVTATARRRRPELAGFAISEAAVLEFVAVLQPVLAQENIALLALEIDGLPAEPPRAGQKEELIAQLLPLLS